MTTPSLFAHTRPPLSPTGGLPLHHNATVATQRRRPKNALQWLRGLAPPLAIMWAGFWGLVTWNILADFGPGAVVGSILSGIAGLLPMAMLLARKRSAPSPPVLSIKPPKSVRSSYRRLLAAHEQISSLADAGIIEPAALGGLDERIDRLARLLTADASNEELGGQPSRQLRSQVDELAELLVRLSDAALDRQSAALESDDRSAVDLRESLQRMRAEERAFRELGELDDQT